jgi:hypothetical protein
MGREIRRVPPNWEHPKGNRRNGDIDYLPMYDQEFEASAREWLDNCIAWDNGTHSDLKDKPEHKIDCPYFWQWDGNPPDADYYRPKFTEEPTWYQVYETVSEGTPVTPPFATKEELVNYLVEHGDFWQQRKWNDRFTERWCLDAEKPGWDREAAEQFVEMEWAPSFMISPSGISKPEDASMYKNIP